MWPSPTLTLPTNILYQQARVNGTTGIYAGRGQDGFAAIDQLAHSPNAQLTTRNSRPGLARMSIADYLARLHPAQVGLVIWDEAHTAKGQSTDTGHALAVVAGVADHILLMTGTLFGGYASSVFHLAYRLHARAYEIYAEVCKDELEEQKESDIDLAGSFLHTLRGYAVAPWRPEYLKHKIRKPLNGRMTHIFTRIHSAANNLNWACAQCGRSLPAISPRAYKRSASDAGSRYAAATSPPISAAPGSKNTAPSWTQPSSTRKRSKLA